VPTRTETMQLAFAAIHRMDHLIFPDATAIPNNWDAVGAAYRDAARLSAICLWRHFLWLSDASHRWPNQEIEEPKEMRLLDILKNLRLAKDALNVFDTAITPATPDEKITWPIVIKALADMITNLAPIIDHLLEMFEPKAKTGSTAGQQKQETP